MPFTTIKTEELIHEKKQKDKVFAKQWDESRNEYKLIQEMIKIRKEQHITQRQLTLQTSYLTRSHQSMLTVRVVIQESLRLV